jgi:spore coat protein CotH
MRTLSPVLIAVSLLLAATAEADHEQWVAAAAHVAGDAGSAWRTDLMVLNPCPVDATIEVRLHTTGATFSATFELAAQGQQVLPDVVALLTAGDGSGSLELRSDQPVEISSRTYSVGADGTFGQSLGGVEDGDGIDEGESATVPGLVQDPRFRCNIGAVNMGAGTAVLDVVLHDRSGLEVGSFDLTIPAGEAAQSNSPYQRLFGRTDIVAGYAVVTVISGRNVWAYASVIDRSSNDPTTQVMRVRDDDCDTSSLLGPFFSLDAAHTIRIDVDDDGIASLLAAPREYVGADVAIDSESFNGVGLRLKGGAGSFIPLDGDYPPVSGDGNCRPGKSAFIVDFNRFDKGLSFHGLDKLMLNNMVQDDSGVHETLGYALFREAGVPASRTAYATVSLNGEDKGVYLVLESPDNGLFLDTWYGTDEGNLYEGAYGADFTSEVMAWFDQDNGEDESRQDIADVVAALDGIAPGDDPSTVLESLFDLDEVLDFTATELYLGHWDGYAWSANNYFVHHEPDDGPWTFLPWGLDQLFEDALGPYAGVMREPGPAWGSWGGRVQALCVASPTCRTRLHTAFSDLLVRVTSMDLEARAAAARTVIEPLLLAESSLYGDPSITTAALDQVESFIAGRNAELERWLPCLAGATIDQDGDGYDGCTADCNDANAAVHPGATEACNLADDDCNGIVDDPGGCPRCIAVAAPDGRSYGLCFDRLSWSAARQRCRAEGHELASLHDLPTVDRLAREAIERLGAERAWIGLNDLVTEGAFEWADGSALDCTAWASGSPRPEGEGLDCVVNAPWGWSDEPCEQELAFVCSTGR